MVYIAPDGTIHKNPPWSIQRFIGFFWGIISFVIFFFKTLVGLEGNSGSGRSRYGGGRGGPSGPGGGPGRGPRTLKDINTSIDDCSMPGGG